MSAKLSLVLAPGLGGVGGGSTAVGKGGGVISVEVAGVLGFVTDGLLNVVRCLIVAFEGGRATPARDNGEDLPPQLDSANRALGGVQLIAIHRHQRSGVLIGGGAEVAAPVDRMGDRPPR